MASSAEHYRHPHEHNRHGNKKTDIKGEKQPTTRTAAPAEAADTERSIKTQEALPEKGTAVEVAHGPALHSWEEALLVAEAAKKPTMHTALTATLSLSDGTSIELPVVRDAAGARFVDVQNLFATAGICTYDPGFTSTASCASAVRARCSYGAPTII